MSFSNIELCSKALNKIGANSITSFEDGTVESEICESIYLELKHKLLCLYEWSFAIKTASLVMSNEENRYGYNYAFILPVDFLRAVKIVSGAKYKIAGSYLFCDDDKVELEYISDVEEASFSPLFVSSFIYLMAAELSISLLNDTSKYALFYRLFNSEIKNAKSIDGMQQTTKSLKNFSLIDVRK
ncbi:MAG: hypothetical protein IJ638_04175 [Alphaproteobacteria bacterium]|nr:hypothetical protein [Alphaproteobacteria bacterium]